MLFYISHVSGFIFFFFNKYYLRYYTIVHFYFCVGTAVSVAIQVEDIGRDLISDGLYKNAHHDHSVIRGHGYLVNALPYGHSDFMDFIPGCFCDAHTHMK